MPSSSPTPSEHSSGSKCRTAVRVPLFILNLITWIAGGGLIGLGIWVVSTNNAYKHFAVDQHVYIVYMCLSAVLFTAGTFGACGVLFGNRTLLRMYFFLITLVFLALFGVVIFGAVQKGLVKDVIRTSWNKTTDDTRIFFQKTFDCCGIDENVYADQASNTHASCFVNTTTIMERKQDCFSKLMELFEDYQLIIAICGATVMLIMLVLMISSCWLIHQFGKSNKNKRNRVVPIKIDQNGAEMADIEESDEDHYPSGRKKTGKKWAKNNTHF